MSTFYRAFRDHALGVTAITLCRADDAPTGARLIGSMIAHGHLPRPNALSAVERALGDDLQQRRAGAIQVDTAHAVKVFVQRFARVLLKVSSSDSDCLYTAVAQDDVDLAPAHDGMVKLTDLVTLGQIGIKVVLAIKDGMLSNFGLDAEAKHHGHAHGFLIQHRQHAWHGEVYSTCAKIGRAHV